MAHKYMTLTRLRQLGITVAQLADADALLLIQDVSEQLDALTKQFFAPSLEVHPADGDDSRIVNHKSLVPILEVTNLTVDVNKNRTNYFSDADRVFGRNRNAQNRYDLTRYEIVEPTKRRLLSLLLGEFPRGVGNVLMTGAFGFLEKLKVFETTLAVDLDIGNTTVTLTDVSNDSGFIELGDYVVVEMEAASVANPQALVYMDIVQGIAGNVLTVDAVAAQAGLPATSGTKVRSFGAFPPAMNRVMDALLLKAWDMDPRNPNGSGSGSVDDRITSERVDNYSYQLESKSVIYQRAGGYGLITGDVLLDKILSKYCRPAGYIGYA